MILQQHLFNDVSMVELDLIKRGGSTQFSHFNFSENGNI